MRQKNLTDPTLQVVMRALNIGQLCVLIVTNDINQLSSQHNVDQAHIGHQEVVKIKVDVTQKVWIYGIDKFVWNDTHDPKRGWWTKSPRSTRENESQNCMLTLSLV